jgi:hypothetical protein
MATAKWSSLGTRTVIDDGTASNPLNTTLTNGSTSAFMTYDNSSGLNLYGIVELNLASLNPTTGASVTLRVWATHNSGTAPDNTGSVGGGETYTVPVTTGSGAKVVNFPMVRLYPTSMRMAVTNNTNVSFAASGNTCAVQPYNEAIA